MHICIYIDIYVERERESCGENFRSDFYAFYWFTDLESSAFLGKLTVEQYFKSFEVKSNFLEFPILAFSNSLQYSFEEARVLSNLIFLVLS